LLAIIALVIAGVVVLSHTAPAPFLLEAFRPSKSLWRVAPTAGAPPTIYLTFDDGPNPDWTPALLDVLEAERVPATFFLIDDHITAETAPIVSRMGEEGHAIGLHSNTRRLMVMKPETLAATLTDAALRISKLTGKQPCRLFRPHAGWRSASMYDGLEATGYRLAGWSWGMWDWAWWRTPKGEHTARRLARKASAGDIIVIHDGHHKDFRPDRRHAPEAIRLLVPALKAKGFSFGRLCDMQAP
jgi:peptidoglycan/xylan/chitin deacetylase (PgdA/CDA1 family)